MLNKKVTILDGTYELYMTYVKSKTVSLDDCETAHLTTSTTISRPTDALHYLDCQEVVICKVSSLKLTNVTKLHFNLVSQLRLTFKFKPTDNKENQCIILDVQC